MEIVFYRQGFPNNSSSSHGIVFSSSFSIQESASGDYSFNWEHFVLRSRREKEKYLFIALYESVAEYLRIFTELPYEYRPVAQKAIFGSIVKYITCFKYLDEMLEEDGISDGNIDHQSTLYFPLAYKNSGGPCVIDMNFFNAFCDDVLSDEFVIHGGNDNEDSPWEYGTPHPMYRMLKSGVAKFSIYDSVSQDFIIVTPSCGDEIRVNFNKRAKAVKSGIPTLVDVCIGSYCDKGCAFCYQGSTSSGKWAETRSVKYVIDALVKCNTINIVLGGGEPTKHPDLHDIVNSHAANPIVAFSVTTRNYDWHNDVNFAKCAKFIKSVAISCNSIDDLHKALPLAEALTSNDVQVSFQNIIGLQSEFDLKAYLDEVGAISHNSLFRRNIGVTLLGWKGTERGASGPPYDLMGKWVPMAVAFNKATGISVSADASLTSSHSNDLIRAGVEHFKISAQEGMYSCYIDALEGYIRKCSYEGHKFPLYTSNNLWVEEKHILGTFRAL